MRVAERQGQIGEERLGLLGREDQRRPGVEACFKSAKKLELQVRLGRHCSSGRPCLSQPSPRLRHFPRCWPRSGYGHPIQPRQRQHHHSAREEGDMRELTLGDPRRSADRDADLVKALRRQETGAIEALIARHGDRVYRLAMRITGNRPDAEEVVQDVLWTVVRRIETFRGDAAIGSWLYRITANCAYTILRVRRARHQETWMNQGSVTVDEYVPAFQEWSACIEDPVLQLELRNVLIAAIDSLPEDYRAIVLLRDVEGLSPQDVSQITSLTIASVKTRTHRARLVLLKRLGDYLSDRLLSPSPTSPRCGDGRRGRREFGCGSVGVRSAEPHGADPSC